MSLTPDHIKALVEGATQGEREVMMLMAFAREIAALVTAGDEHGAAQAIWEICRRERHRGLRSKHRVNGCCCVFDENGETLLTHCLAHRQHEEEAVAAALAKAGMEVKA